MKKATMDIMISSATRASISRSVSRSDCVVMRVLFSSRVGFERLFTSAVTTCFAVVSVSKNSLSEGFPLFFPPGRDLEKAASAMVSRMLAYEKRTTPLSSEFESIPETRAF